jgi:FkbM family methyltransferase
MPGAGPDPHLTLSQDRGPFRFRECRHGVMAFLRSDDTIGRCLDLYGEFAESENQVMALVARPGDTVIDVGANVGTVTLALARLVGPHGRVYAFEPQRLVFQALCAALVLNGLANVSAYQAAVGNRPRKVRMPALDPTTTFNYGAVQVGPDEGPGEGSLLVTIDSLELSRCDLLKIDAEGMDYEVLLGAAGTVSRHRPVLYMEAKPEEHTPGAIAWLQERSYHCYWHFAAFYSADNYRGVAENIFEGLGDVNLLALPGERDMRPTLPVIRRPDADWQQDYADFLSGKSGG